VLLDQLEELLALAATASPPRTTRRRLANRLAGFGGFVSFNCRELPVNLIELGL
jgi:hypothetical protein